MKKTNFKNGTLVSKAKVTINGTIYEVEPEEYEGETPLSAEVLNEMEDNIENAIAEVNTDLNKKITNLTTYSTQEIKTGEYWIDGKPIYKKVFNFTVSDTDENLIPHNIQNVSNIWLGNKSHILSETNHIPVNYYRDSGIFVWTLVNDTNIRIKIGVNGWTNKPICITLEYTKTTD